MPRQAARRKNQVVHRAGSAAGHPSTEAGRAGGESDFAVARLVSSAVLFADGFDSGTDDWSQVLPQRPGRKPSAKRGSRGGAR